MGDTVDAAFSDAETRALRDIAGTMVPADAALGVPGADDPAIMADIVKSLGRDLAHVREAVAAIGAKAGGNFVAMDVDSREALLSDYIASGGAAGAALARAVLQCYYRDDRVLISLGMEPRAPFPKGHVLEQGDWSLLDPVRRRAPFWRKDR
ncbi:MAG: hypothetical protein KF889_06375 [Alphaproteobacteria bacterium]|nr:hypothetical protein [Alphaproteobacteria bacterium]MCW5740444.1 hypothetical protein [Alphaproteobacteria bacterium]